MVHMLASYALVHVCYLGSIATQAFDKTDDYFSDNGTGYMTRQNG